MPYFSRPLIRPLTQVGAILTLCSLVGCAEPRSSQSTPNAAEPSANLPQVVATTAVLCDLTRQIAQETIALTCIMPPDQDPHVYKPTPSDRKAIEAAKLVLYSGYQYEPGLIKIVESTGSAVAKVPVYEVAVPKPLMGEAHDHDHEEAGAENEADHAHEAAAGEQVPDPHVWHDARNGSQIVTVIQDTLAKLVPAQADRYQTNAAALTEQLTQLDAWIKKQVATVPAVTRKLVTTHEALGYYAKAYGFQLEGTIEGLSTEERPSAARLAELVDQLKASQVPTIFVETTTNAKQLETVAKEAKVKIAEQPLFIEGPGGAGSPAPTYQAMLAANTCTIVEGLGGQCDRASAPVP